jgi:4-amino-4-deoxy-L-arabinose transferase-like glycosyltransferase
VLLLHVALGAISMTGDSSTVDESSHLAFGTDGLAGAIEHANMQRMPITAINAVPKKLCRSLGVRLSPDQELFVSRFPSLLLSAVTGLFVFLWSRRLYGMRGALLSLTVFALCPTILAHGRLITTDVTCTLFCFLSVLSFLNYLRKPTWPRFFLAVGLTGLAQLAKHTSLLLFPLFFVLLVLRGWGMRKIPGKGLPRYLAARALLFLALVLVIINTGYAWKGTGETLEQNRTWLQLHTAYVSPPLPSEEGGILDRLKLGAARLPLPLPRAYVETYLLGQHFNRTGQGHGPIYLLGEMQPLGWKSYFTIAFLLKTPLPIIALILAGLAVALRTRRLGLVTDELVCVLSASVVFAYFSFLCTAQIGIRYLMPMLPFLYVLIGQVAVWSPPRLRWGWRVGVVAMVAWLGISSLSYFPHYICYFNEICWDRRLLYKYLADSNLDWDQGRRHLDKYLKSHAGESIPVNPPSPTSGTFIVRANTLLGLEFNPETYRWLRETHTPVGHVAYSYLIYKLPGPVADSGTRPEP